MNGGSKAVGKMKTINKSIVFSLYYGKIRNGKTPHNSNNFQLNGVGTESPSVSQWVYVFNTISITHSEGSCESELVVSL